MSKLPLPNALTMPLRDVMRGLASFAEATEDLFAPAAKSVLPERVRSALREALHQIEGSGAAMLADVDAEDIHRAADFLGGASAGPGDAACCAKVLAFAWDKVQADAALHPLLSEALAAARLSRLRSAEGPPEDLVPSRRAAEVLQALRGARVAGALPGLPADLSAEERETIDQRLFGLAIWLLAERGADLADEMRLLDMAMALARAYQTDIRTASEDPEALAPLLKSVSDHL